MKSLSIVYSKLILLLLYAYTFYFNYFTRLAKTNTTMKKHANPPDFHSRSIITYPANMFIYYLFSASVILDSIYSSRSFLLTRILVPTLKKGILECTILRAQFFLTSKISHISLMFNISLSLFKFFHHLL